MADVVAFSRVNVVHVLVDPRLDGGSVARGFIVGKGRILKQHCTVVPSGGVQVSKDPISCPGFLRHARESNTTVEATNRANPAGELSQTVHISGSRLLIQERSRHNRRHISKTVLNGIY